MLRGLTVTNSNSNHKHTKQQHKVKEHQSPPNYLGQGKNDHQKGVMNLQVTIALELICLLISIGKQVIIP